MVIMLHSLARLYIAIARSWTITLDHAQNHPANPPIQYWSKSADSNIRCVFSFFVLQNFWIIDPLIGAEHIIHIVFEMGNDYCWLFLMAFEGFLVGVGWCWYMFVWFRLRFFKLKLILDDFVSILMDVGWFLVDVDLDDCWLMLFVLFFCFCMICDDCWLPSIGFGWNLIFVWCLCFWLLLVDFEWLQVDFVCFIGVDDCWLSCCWLVCMIDVDGFWNCFVNVEGMSMIFTGVWMVVDDLWLLLMFFVVCYLRLDDCLTFLCLSYCSACFGMYGWWFRVSSDGFGMFAKLIW